MRYQVRLTKVVHDIVEAFVTVEAESTDDAKFKAIEKAGTDDLDWRWHHCLDLPGGDDIEADEPMESPHENL